MGAAAAPKKTGGNAFTRIIRKLYQGVGFSKGYNAALWFIFAGALFGFTIARLQYLAIGSIYHKGSLPGEWFWLHKGFRRVGITIHLASILPASLLVVLQFTPIIRRKFLIFHRIAGYLAITLLIISNASAMMIARHTAGGGLETQTLLGLLAVLTTVSVALAYYNIKKLQIEQHRAWMLRTWFYAASIITLRIIMIISALIMSSNGTYYRAERCDLMEFTYRDRSSTPDNFLQDFPACALPNATYVAVQASMNGDSVTVGAALGIGFGMAGWLALALHAIGVEMYLRLTPREGERLRRVSYERQMERGMKNPGSAGTVVQRFGDADEWSYASKEVKVRESSEE